MAQTVKVDVRSFNRGANEVLKFKPIRRAITQIITGKRKRAGDKVSVPSVNNKRKNDKQAAE